MDQPFDRIGEEGQPHPTAINKRVSITMQKRENGGVIGIFLGGNLMSQ
jgi:hypothetical protein